VIQQAFALNAKISFLNITIIKEFVKLFYAQWMIANYVKKIQYIAFNVIKDLLFING
jgi:hypothetical protein